MIIDRIPLEGKHFSLPCERLSPHFETALRFMRTADFSALPPGRTEIDGDRVFVNVQEYTQQAKEAAYEAHARYADIQLILSGSERFRWGRGIPGPLDAEKDFCAVECRQYVEFVLREGQFVVFMPGEAHAPGLPEKDEAFCRKAVIKVLSADARE